MDITPLFIVLYDPSTTLSLGMFRASEVEHRLARAQIPGIGGEMAAAHGELMGGRGGDGNGLLGSATGVRTQGALSGIMARRWTDVPCFDPEERLLVSIIVLESSPSPRWSWRWAVREMMA